MNEKLLIKTIEEDLENINIVYKQNNRKKYRNIITNEDEEDFTFILMPGKVQELVNVKYIKQINHLCISKHILDTRKFEKNKKFDLRLKEYFLINEKKEISVYNGKEINLEEYRERSIVLVQKDNEIIRNIRKLFPALYRSQNNWDDFFTYSEFITYLSSNKLNKKNNKTQAKIDKLVSYEVSDISNVKFNYKERYTITEYKYASILECINENIIVLRYFYRLVRDRKVKEVSRFYITDTDLYFCVRNEQGQFIAKKEKMNVGLTLSKEMKFVNKKYLKNSRLKYIYKILLSEDTSKRSALLYTFLTNPEAEQIYKSGCEQILYRYIKQTEEAENLENFIAKEYAYYDNKKHTIYQKLGLNKYQKEKLMNKQNPLRVTYSAYTQTELIRKMLNAGDISNIDNKIFDKVYAIAEKITEDIYKYPFVMADIYAKILSVSSHKNAQAILKRLEVKKVGNMCMYYYNDYLEMADELGMLNKDSYYFKDYADILKKHDEICVIYEVKEKEESTKKYKKIKGSLKKYTYENDKYKVIVPEDINDIIRESVELRHCVEGYIPKIVSKKTNILFIRKKDDLKKPFYTMEISNKKTIEQVHGFANKNANKESGLSGFIKEYAKNKDLKLNNINKTLYAN